MPIFPDPIEIELQTHDPTKVLRLSEVEWIAAHGEYRCLLVVRSGGFACERPFYFDDPHLPKAITALQKMDSGRPGEAIIKGEWEKDFIKLASNDMGHVVVTGEIYEHAELAQTLRFAFRTDQTVLGPLIRDLSSLLKS